MIRLHHVPQARSFRVLWALQELGLPHAVVRHSFFDRSLRDPAYLALSPAGRVPALEIDGRALFESGAILQYLAGREGRLGAPPAEQPEWLEWIHFAETIAAHVANLTQQHIVLREDRMRSPTVMRLEAQRLARTLRVIEDRLAGDHLLASGFSMADIAASYGAMIGRRFVRLGDLPRVAAWLDRLSARPAFVAAQAEDGPPQIYLKDFHEAPDA